jgi:hypothetical protein
VPVSQRSASAISFKDPLLSVPSHGGFGFIGRTSFVFELRHHVIKVADFVNIENHFVKIIFFSVKRNQMASIYHKDSLISVSNVGFKGGN